MTLSPSSNVKHRSLSQFLALCASALLALAPGQSHAFSLGFGGIRGGLPRIQGSDWLEGSRPTQPVEAEDSSAPQVEAVAVCFYGLTRSLTLTYDSIQRNLLSPIRDAGFQVDVFLHTFNVSTLTSPTPETGSLNATEWKLLQPVTASITSQADFQAASKDEIDKCKRTGHGWQGDFKFDTLSNHLSQLKSLSQVAYLWRRSHAERNYKAIIYARPDVHFNCPFPVHHLINIKPKTVYIPNNSHYKGVNDRFAMAVPDTARKLGNRLFYTLALCSHYPVNSEMYLKSLLGFLHFDLVKMNKFEFFRIRATGYIAAGDLMTMRGCDLSQLAAFPVRPQDVPMVTRLRTRLLRQG